MFLLPNAATRVKATAGGNAGREAHLAWHKSVSADEFIAGYLRDLEAKGEGEFVKQYLGNESLEFVLYYHRQLHDISDSLSKN